MQQATSNKQQATSNKQQATSNKQQATSKFVWSESMNMGIDIIDAQHRKLLELVNYLYDIKDFNNRDKVKNALDKLLKYTVIHFAYEEKIMTEAGYVLLQDHKQTHKLFKIKVGILCQRFEQGEDIMSELINLAQHWLINHIMREDMAFAKSAIGWL